MELRGTHKHKHSVARAFRRPEHRKWLHLHWEWSQSVITYYYGSYQWAKILSSIYITHRPSDSRLQTSERVYGFSCFHSSQMAWAHPCMDACVIRCWSVRACVYACVIYPSQFNIIYTSTMCKRQHEYSAFKIGLTHSSSSMIFHIPLIKIEQHKARTLT